jgi:dTDP-D-glucose 4,6-dehydratase
MAYMHELDDSDGRHRVLYTYDNKVHFVSEDPYGLWRTYLDKGQMSKEMVTQRFTSFSEALKVVTQYYKEKNEVLSREPVVKPVLALKNTKEK